MLCRGELVVKLPATRVEEIVASGLATRFDARKDGRPAREWASVGADRAGTWRDLMQEALDFALARDPGRRL